MKKLLTIITLSALVGTNASNLKPVFMNNVVSHSFKSSQFKITNGTNVPEGKYPWFCTIKGEKIENSAGGFTLISPNWVLTAAHVIAGWKEADQIKLVFGLYDKINYNEDKLETRMIKNVIIWGNNYDDTNNFDFEHDIALIQLDKPVNDIPPISLYSKKEKPKFNTIATVMGWGVNGVDNNGQLTMPTHLQEANIPILDDSVSKNPRWQFPFWNPQTEILAGVIIGSKRINAALADSGGPLIQKIDDKYVLIGIVSHGPIDNNIDNFIDPEPAIYTFVGTFYDWIKKIIWAK